MINGAIDEARRIFGRINSYLTYRIALTLDIMFVVVLSTIFLSVSPLTAIMIVVMSLLNDLPMMTIAYDNTPVNPRPVRWELPRIFGLASMLGAFLIAESFGLLLFGVKVLSEPHLQATFGLATHAQLQTMMFLQLVGGGQLLLFITRTENWFFQQPYPAAPLLGAIAGTQLTAALMCGFGLLVPAISWKLIGWVWLYIATWMFILGSVRIIYDRFASYRTARHLKSAALVNQSLQPHVPAA